MSENEWIETYFSNFASWNGFGRLKGEITCNKNIRYSERHLSLITVKKYTYLSDTCLTVSPNYSTKFVYLLHIINILLSIHIQVFSKHYVFIVNKYWNQQGLFRIIMTHFIGLSIKVNKTSSLLQYKMSI